MVKTGSFLKRIGAVSIPEADQVIREPDRESLIASFSPEMLSAEAVAEAKLQPLKPYPWPHFKFCSTTLKEGCYTLNYRPKNSSFWGPFYRGTLRVENLDAGLRFSGDFYTYWRFFFPFPGPLKNLEFARKEEMLPEMRAELATGDAADTDGVIPIYRRRDYYSYLKGTATQLFAITPKGNPCWFSLSFDEFNYQHPATGFSGSFPNSPTRSVRFTLNHTDTPDLFNGKAFEGSTELGTVSIRWVSPYFRRATLQIHTLVGADAPQAVTDGSVLEDFHTIFATAGWDLIVNYAGTISLPASLQGVQDPNTCWPPANSATLMQSVPGYDPDELDKVWKARLLAIPADLGCARGRMFDNSTGDPNDVPREGAVTHSHDGYPAADSPNFGAAEGGLQRDFPRAFLRSAAHEVGHTFNQIHQVFESGQDNSIMTVTPGVANVLTAAGLTFPDEINLAVNATVRRHLAHLPDPAVRPGGMEFFGAAVNAPEADHVVWLTQLVLTVDAASDVIRLGEPLPIKWKLTNSGDQSLPVPDRLNVESLTARVSVTDPIGKVTFMRPPNQETCSCIAINDLEPENSVKDSTVVFWGRDGFAFETPGRHVIEIIILWEFNGVHFGTSGETEVWVTHPLTERDNQIAALLLNPNVGRAIAFGDTRGKGSADKRIKQVAKLQKGHPAAVQLRKLGLIK